MKKIISLFLAIGFASFSFNASASYYCTGNVSMLALSPNGFVTTQIGTVGTVYLCVIDSNSNGVTANACKTIYAHLLSAQLSNTQVTIGFNDSLTCTTHPAWAFLTGWYWGPQTSAN